MTIHEHVVLGTLNQGHWQTGLFTDDSDAGTLEGSHTAWLAAIGELIGPGTSPNTGIRSLMSNNTSVTTATSYSLNPDTGKKTARITTAVANSGTSATQVLPNNLCCMVLLDTQDQVRGETGRMYLPPFVVGQLQGGLFFSTPRTQVSIAVQFTLRAMNTAGYEVIVYQRGLLQGRPVSSVRVAAIPAVMKSRADEIVRSYTTIAI